MIHIPNGKTQASLLCDDIGCDLKEGDDVYIDGYDGDDAIVIRISDGKIGYIHISNLRANNDYMIDPYD